MSQAYDYSFSVFCLVHLESVFRWRLGAIKILLELEIKEGNDTKVVPCKWYSKVRTG